MDKEDEFESPTVRAVFTKQYNKDVDDLTMEVENLSLSMTEFSKEILEDLCEVCGLYVDRYAMDKFNALNKKQDGWRFLFWVFSLKILKLKFELNLEKV